MPMAMVVTRNVEARYRGFLTSIMLEVAPGVYVAPDLSAGVRTRVWDVLSAWWEALARGRSSWFGGYESPLESLHRDPRRTPEGDRGR